MIEIVKPVHGRFWFVGYFLLAFPGRFRAHGPQRPNLQDSLDMFAVSSYAEPAMSRSIKIPVCTPRITRIAICAMWMSLLAGCGEVWTDPLSTAAEYEKGLVVMYPGALVSDSEMLGFWGTFRLAGVDQAIEVAQWTTPLSYELNAVEANRTSRASAVIEAERLAEYIRAHPNSPVDASGLLRRGHVRHHGGRGHAGRRARSTN